MILDKTRLQALETTVDRLTVELQALRRLTSPGGGSGGHIIQDEGVTLPQRAALNFVGGGASAADVGGKTVVTVPGGGATNSYFPGGWG